LQVNVDGTQSSGNCTYTDWQNQWHWETNDIKPAAIVAAEETESATTVTSRLFACMVNFSSGQLLVFGGQNDAAANNDTWVFEPLAGAGWRLVSGHPAPVGRWSAGCCSEGSMMYMHGGAADNALSLSDLWSFNITSLKWTQLLSSTCNADPSTCSLAMRGHVFVKFMSFLYAWDTLAGRLARFNLVSNAWESLISPSVQRFQHLSIAQISSHAFLSLGLTIDATSNVVFLIKLPLSGSQVEFKHVNASEVPLVVGGCMLAFSSQILVLGGKPTSSAPSNRYRCSSLCF
jgi:hypothetical protein